MKQEKPIKSISAAVFIPPFPEDAARRFLETIEKHPEVFDPSVAEALRKVMKLPATI